VIAMENEYLLGIDAGTSKIKVILFDTRGNEIASIAKNSPVTSSDDGFIQQDMLETFNLTVKCISEVICKSKVKKKLIRGVGITAQGEGAWLVDKSGNPLREAILWNDSRASKIVDKFNNPALRNKIRDITGSFPYAGATTFILKWLKVNEPQLLRELGFIFNCKDWIRFKLTGEAYLDYTDSSTSILDIKNNVISQELLKILDIEEFYKFFPKIKHSFECGGHITKEISILTGLLEGTPVAIGMLDVVASTLGSGARSKNDICTILGTTCCNAVVTDSYKFTKDNSGFENFVEKDTYVNIIGAMAGTLNLDWFIRNFYSEQHKNSISEGSDIYEILEEKIKGESALGKGIIYHPYISVSGERAPFYNINARAQFFGLCQDTKKELMLRAIYEGVAFSIKDCLREYESNENIYLSGGGSSSKIWPQIIADATGKNVIIAEGNEFAARGAIISAGICSGVYSDIGEAVNSVIRKEKTFYPNSISKKKYDDFYELYVSIRDNSMSCWNKRRKILEKT
jgi:sugar (pentulose or hexulose) kinase